MAKRTRTIITDDDADHLDETQQRARDARRMIDEDPAEQQYGEFIAKYRGSQGCRVKVYRQTPRGRQYCFFGTPDEIESEETIRLYHAKQPYAHEEGLYFLSVEVNGELRNSVPVHVAPQVGTPGTETQAQSGGMAEIVRLLQAQNDRLEQRLLASERTPMVEMVDAMHKLDQMRGPSQLPVDTLMKAIELGQKMNGTGQTSDWSMILVEALKDNAPMLLTTLQRVMARPAASPAPESAGQPAAAAQPEPTTERIEETMPAEEQEKLMMKQVLDYLKKKAMAGSDPGLYIDLIVDNREDPLYAKLISQIVEQDFSAFAAIDADLTKPQYSGFFDAIYNGIRSVFVPKSTVAAAGSGKGRNKPNPPSNGAKGAGGGS